MVLTVEGENFPGGNFLETKIMHPNLSMHTFCLIESELESPDKNTLNFFTASLVQDLLPESVQMLQ